MPYITQSALQPYIDDHLISDRTHPDAPWLHIYNYTSRTTYEGLWDEMTLRCRGLILDHETQTVKAACMRKAFNYEEHVAKGWDIPQEMPIVTVKYDGWMGTLYWLNDAPWIATRGSFTSAGAQWATQWFRDQIPRMAGDELAYWSNPYVTHVFEIIAPVTYILVQYPFEGLVHLATLDMYGGWDMGMQSQPCIPRSEIIKPDDYRTLTAMSMANAEGFVCLFPESQARIKLKYKEYMHLHTIVSHLSAHRVWMMLRDGETSDGFNAKLPAHPAGEWARQKGQVLLDAQAHLQREVEVTYRDMMGMQLSRAWGKDKGARDKEIALLFNTHPLRAHLFNYHRYQQALWNAVEPTGSETYLPMEEE